MTMARQVYEESKSLRQVSLYLGSSPREAWEEVLLPWFERVLPETWKRALPSLVVVPTRGQANDLKARLFA